MAVSQGEGVSFRDFISGQNCEESHCASSAVLL